MQYRFPEKSTVSISSAKIQWYFTNNYKYIYLSSLPEYSETAMVMSSWHIHRMVYRGCCEKVNVIMPINQQLILTTVKDKLSEPSTPVVFNRHPSYDSASMTLTHIRHFSFLLSASRVCRCVRVVFTQRRLRYLKGQFFRTNVIFIYLLLFVCSVISVDSQVVQTFLLSVSAKRVCCTPCTWGTPYSPVAVAAAAAAATVVRYTSVAVKLPARRQNNIILPCSSYDCVFSVTMLEETFFVVNFTGRGLLVRVITAALYVLEVSHS